MNSQEVNWGDTPPKVEKDPFHITMNQEMSRGEHHMLAEIEVVPFTREGEDTSFVNKAIALIRESKLKHEVNALGTTIEGSPDQVWPLLRAVHNSCVKNGAAKVCTNIKVYENTKFDRSDTIDGRKNAANQP